MTIATAAIAADVNSVTIAGRRFEISTAVSTGTMSNHGEMLNVASNAASIVAVSAADAGDEVKLVMVNVMMAISIEGMVVTIIY
jgi:hypothetical protein